MSYQQLRGWWTFSLFSLGDFLRNESHGGSLNVLRLPILSSRRRVAGFASGGSRFLRRNYPAFVSGEETLMALRSSSTVITGSAKIGWFVWFPRECSRCVKGSLWRWGPELG
ncbi:hypothetical protein YC2023_062517 [Brassica napus]